MPPLSHPSGHATSLWLPCHQLGWLLNVVLPQSSTSTVPLRNNIRTNSSPTACTGAPEPGSAGGTLWEGIQSKMNLRPGAASPTEGSRANLLPSRWLPCSAWRTLAWICFFAKPTALAARPAVIAPSERWEAGIRAPPCSALFSTVFIHSYNALTWLQFPKPRADA